MTSTDNQSTFGYWYGPHDQIPITTGTIYHLYYEAFSDVEDPEKVPYVRFRTNTQDYQQADYIVLPSVNGAEQSPTTTPRVYELIIDPPDGSEFFKMSCDLVNFDEDDAVTATIFLDAVMLEETCLTDDFFMNPTSVMTYDFTTSALGWTTSTCDGAYIEPKFSWSTGALNITSCYNDDVFGYWRSNSSDLLIEAGKFYRMQYTVKSNLEDRHEVTKFRLRVNLLPEWAARLLISESFGSALNSPTIDNPITYSLYFLPPPEAVGTYMYLAFDMVNFGLFDEPNQTISLEHVQVDSFDLP